jgi:RiboL-PSP-HEPN
MTDPMEGLIQNVREVRRLMQIHQLIGGATRGRKHDLEVLNKSGVVLLVACWEAFVEDLAATAFDFILARATDHTVFPSDVLVQASKSLKANLDNREVWKLAGQGWKSVLQAHRDAILGDYVGKLNSPKSKNVDALFASLIGIGGVSQGWTWHRMSSAAAVERLENLIELRGAIAHRVGTSKAVRKVAVTDSIDFVYRISVKTSNRVRAFVYARTKERPWGPYKFRTVE